VIFNKITIIGIGLIGGSILKDIKAKNLCNILSAFDNDAKSLEIAYQQNLTNDISNSLEDAIQDSDLIIICVPLSKYSPTFNAINKVCNDDVIITDIGSVKSSVIEDAKKNLSEKKLKNFVPSHPIAGSEKSGFKSSVKNLYKNKIFYVTPLSQSNQKAIDLVKKLWIELGSNIIEKSCEEHDKIFALSSHIPHLLSFCYAKAINEISNESISILKEKNIDFAIFIRLAFSNSKMWADIFLANRSIILIKLEKYFLHYFDFVDNFPIKKIVNDVNESKEFRKTIKIEPAIKTEFNEHNKGYHDDLLLDIFPLLISSQMVQSIKDIYNDKIVGAGFLGITKNLINVKNHSNDLANQIYETRNIAKIFLKELDVMLQNINNNDEEAILNYIENIK
jgi:prephenate dehydrogenase